ncbi:hypothetical protein AB6F13_01375 [Staphylococcus saprophyticus]|uniref:hypothetical protein n=1 Tax=Staphylococcus saprophyticus TaxID=29385 RepID=UPI002979B4D3|nr:hypothetical protein [Staphylococcus saprophyticus]
MGIAEQILDELKRLNKNLQVTNVELSTVDESVVQNVVKEAPINKAETPKQGKEEPKQQEPKQESTEQDQTYSKDDVLNLGKTFVQKADAEDKKAFKTKLEELGANKLSNISEDDFTEIVDFMNARLSA